MQQPEKEITNRIHIDQIIQKSTICRLALCQDNKPYLIPLSFGYDGPKIYFHTSLEGMKIEYMRRNNQVCFEFEHDIRILGDKARGCDWSVSFLSVIGFGKVAEITKYEAKVAALNQIMLHYSSRTWEFDKKSVDNCRLWRIEIESMTGKKSKDKDITNLEQNI